MLQDIRKSSQGMAAKIIIGLIVAAFALFGIESILVSGGGGSMAQVNGEKVYPGEVQQLVNTQKRRLITMLGENLDPSMLDDQKLTAEALQSIIGRKLQMQSATAMNLGISERTIGLIVSSMDQFKVDGRFSPEAYKSVLSGAGYTTASFKQSLAEDLVLNQLNSGLTGSDFATPGELELNAAHTAERRDIRYLTIPLEKFALDLEISDAQIQEYYDARPSEFMSRETVDLDYIELTLDAFRQPVEESVLLEQYELEQENYQYQTQSSVSHILFERGAEEDEDAYRARIQAVRDQLASGADFAELARTASDDIGSANFGGELGSTEGDTFPEEMEEAIAGLVIGEVSGPVRTEAGTHLIKLTARVDGVIPPLEELRSELEARIQSREARRELILVAEQLKDLAFNAEDLSAPAAELNLTVRQVDGISRSHSEGLFDHASLLAAAFSDDVLQEGHNSEVIELPNDRYVTLRVRTHHEPELQPLDAVRGEIAARITQETARAAVIAAADRALTEIPQVGMENYANEQGYEWQVELAATRRNAMVPRPVLRRAFELPAPEPGHSTLEYVVTPEGDVQVLELDRVTPGSLATLKPTERSQLQQAIVAEHGRILTTEFLRALRDSAEIEIL